MTWSLHNLHTENEIVFFKQLSEIDGLDIEQDAFRD